MVSAVIFSSLFWNMSIIGEAAPGDIGYQWEGAYTTNGTYNFPQGSQVTAAINVNHKIDTTNLIVGHVYLVNIYTNVYLTAETGTIFTSSSSNTIKLPGWDDFQSTPVGYVKTQYTLPYEGGDTVSFRGTYVGRASDGNCTAKVRMPIKIEFIDTTEKTTNEHLDDINKGIEAGNDIAKETQEQEKKFFDGFFGNLIESLIGVFVPEDGYFSDYFNRLNDFFSDKFGFLYSPIDIMVQFFELFMNIGDTPELTFPGFSIMGYTVWEPVTVNWEELVSGFGLFDYIRVGGDAIIIISFVNFVSKKYEEVVGS